MFKDLFSLKGRVALVTGGSRGIGKMIAAGFLAQGAAKVYITARKAGPCEATAKELTAAYDGECIALPIDISTVEGCDKLASEFIKQEPKLDILVNNAGAAWGAEFDEFPESGWDKVMDLNVKSVFFLTQKLLDLLEAAGSKTAYSRVINIGSIEVMLITLAGRSRLAAAFSAGWSAWVRKKGDLTLRSITLSQPFSGNTSNGSPQAAPALLTRMSSASVCSASWAASALQPATVDTSWGRGMHFSPSSFAVSKQASALREEI